MPWRSCCVPRSASFSTSAPRQGWQRRCGRGVLQGRLHQTSGAFRCSPRRTQRGKIGIMMIEELGRHLAVCSLTELERMLKMDARFWNVVSIREPYIPRPPCLRYAKSYHEAIFDDLERIDLQAAK